jgi:hypothetical protein
MDLEESDHGLIKVISQNLHAGAEETDKKS